MLRSLGTVVLAAALQVPQLPVVTGRVLSADTGTPLPNARLVIPNPGSESSTVVLSDSDGRFTLRPATIPATVSCSKTGYDLRQLPLTNSTRTIECRLAAASVISGRVVDENGEPVVGAIVSVEPTSQQRSETDDRGEYRIGGLPAGTYAVAVHTFGTPTINDVRPRVLMPIANTLYYRASPTIESAQRLTVSAGEHLDSVDFLVPTAQSGMQPFSVVTGLISRPMGSIVPMRPQATGAIRGLVRSSDGRPLPYAMVLLRGATVMDRPALVRADTAGRFEYRNVVPGKYQLTASKAGHFPTDVNVSSPGLELKDGEIRENVDLTLRRWSAVSGRVTDDLGEPLSGARVLLLQLRYEGGRRHLVAARSALSDDEGAYRIYAASGGNYVVSATIGGVYSTDVPGYALTYYPGTTTPSQAQFVSLRDGDELGGIDIALERTRTANIRGTILGSDGAPTMGGSVNLTPSQRSSSAIALSAGARLQPNGTFEFPNVSPGQYVIQAYSGRRNRSTEGDFGAILVTVTDRDVNNLVLRMSKGTRLSGRLRVDAADPAKTLDLSQVELTAVPVDLDFSPPSNWATADFRSDGSFELNGVSGTRRLQVLKTPPGWALKEIRVNGIDATDRAFNYGASTTSVSDVEVVVTDRISVLSGRVIGEDGVPSAGSAVLALSTDRSRWYDTSRFLRLVTAREDGTYTIEGLPFGSYYALAVTELPSDGADGWQDPAFLEACARRGVSFTVREGERTSLDVREVRGVGAP